MQQPVVSIFASPKYLKHEYKSNKIEKRILLDSGLDPYSVALKIGKITKDKYFKMAPFGIELRSSSF